VAVIGSEPEIYFYAQRHSATGFIYTYSLMEEQRFALAMQKQMIREIEEAKPFRVVRNDGAAIQHIEPHIADLGRGRQARRRGLGRRPRTNTHANEKCRKPVHSHVASPHVGP